MKNHEQILIIFFYNFNHEFVSMHFFHVSIKNAMKNNITDFNNFDKRKYFQSFKIVIIIVAFISIYFRDVYCIVGDNKIVKQ